MDKLEQARLTFERNIEATTGRSVAAWAELVLQRGLARHGQTVAWLKSEHGFSHSHANHVAKAAMTLADQRADTDPVDRLFEGGKAPLRPIYDAVIEAVRLFGSDVEIAPKRSNVSVRRRKQFALLQPSTRTRLDLGLILKDKAPGGRLEASGAFHAMFSHRVRLASVADVDDRLLGWLKEAYDEAI